MKKILIYFLFACITSLSYSQESKNDTLKLDKKKFLKELSENACKCIDSIYTYNKKKDSITSEIHRCIDQQVGAYQLGIKFSNIEKLKEATATVDGKKEINISLSLDPNSKEYKEYYYEIEEYLMGNCSSIKKKMAENEIIGEKSYSNNEEAMRYYQLGLDESKKEDFTKAIENYKKALVLDPNFAFAYDNIGICYRRLNEYDKAIDAYEKSLKIDPNGTMPLLNIAVAYLYNKEYKKAVKSYEKLAKLEPNNPEVFYGIGNIYAQYLFDFEKALDNLCQAYNIYVRTKSPYRTDAEKLIQYVYSELKKQGKEAIFEVILKKHNISSK
jgi:tetratricopeptide (TPR) repeat protein